MIAWERASCLPLADDVLTAFFSYFFLGVSLLPGVRQCHCTGCRQEEFVALLRLLLPLLEYGLCHPYSCTVRPSKSFDSDAVYLDFFSIIAWIIRVVSWAFCCRSVKYIRPL